MEILAQVLPILLYVLGSVLLVVLIILGIKIIKVVDRTDALIQDVEEKTASLNGLFHMIDTITDTLPLISDRFVDNVTGLLSKLFHRRKKEEEDYE